MVDSSVFKRFRADVFARKWHALATRRREHLAELYESGRWRRYYDEETFRSHMRSAVREVEHWEEVAASDVTRPAPTDRQHQTPDIRAA